MDIQIDSRRRDALLLGVGFELGLGLVAVLLGATLGQPPLEHFAWDAGDAALGVAFCLPMCALFSVLVRWPLGPLRPIKEFLEDVVRPFFRDCTILDLALVALAAGVGEEMLFRGVLQAAAARWWGLAVGLAVASALFGLAHWITPWYALLAALIGLYLGWLWVATGNLLVPIVVHGLYDFLALVYLMRGPRDAPQPAPQNGRELLE